MANRTTDLRRTTFLAAMTLGLLAPGKTGQGRAEPPAAPPTDDAIHVRMLVYKAEVGGKKTAVVGLRRPTGNPHFDQAAKSHQGLLAREVVLQGILLAARDELGLATRDEVLGESLPPDSEAEIKLDVTFTLRLEGGGSPLVVERLEDNRKEKVLDISVGAPGANGYGYLPKLSESVEVLSRDDFPRFLKGLGLGGSPNRAQAAAAVPTRVNTLLESLTFIDDLIAIRDLHQSIRVEGESTSKLGALARAYAQLGMLSEYQWNPAHKAYKARALLYAQRCLAKVPESPEGLRSRAFVLAAVGRARDARTDLDFAIERSRAKDGPEGQGREPAPVEDWAEIVDAFLKADLERLNNFEGPDAKLARLLRMVALEFPRHTSMELDAARDVVRLEPECYRAHDAMCDVGGVQNLHMATTLGVQILTQATPDKLARVESLPAEVQQVLQARGNELEYLEALVRSGAASKDAGEPSWGSLAHLLREARFIQVYRRLRFLRDSLSVPVVDFWKGVRPVVDGHRYAPYLEALALPPGAASRAMGAFLKEIDPTDMQSLQYSIIRDAFQWDQSIGSNLWQFAIQHSDLTTRDWCLTIQGIPGSHRAPIGQKLLDLDPLSTYAMATLIEYDWPRYKDKAKEWELASTRSLALAKVFAERYMDERRFDMAETYWKRAIAIYPDDTSYEELAESYKARGDVARWKETLDEYLDKVEDHGLNHAGVRVKIADEFMKQKRWKEARPYADAAAETWAGWAMACASRCAEGMEDWESAELWMRRVSERYPQSSYLNWFKLCSRTGHGDIKAAAAFAEECFADFGKDVSIQDLPEAGYFFWASGSLKKASEIFEKCVSQGEKGTTTMVHLALVDDELGDTRRREELLKGFCEASRQKAPKWTEVCDIFRAYLAGPKGQPIDIKALQAVLEPIPRDERHNTEFLVGKILMDHGHPAEGLECIRRCSQSPGTYPPLKMVAENIVLRKDASKP